MIRSISTLRLCSSTCDDLYAFFMERATELSVVHIHLPLTCVLVRAV